MNLSEISITATDTAVVVSGQGLFRNNEKEPYGFVVEIVTNEKDDDGIHKIMPVFLPYNKVKMHELCQCVMASPVFMAEISFSNLQIRTKQSGGYYATATDFTIIKEENNDEKTNTTK